jgi:zinc protease
LKRLQSQALTGLAIRAQSTSEMASLAFDKALYDKHPYSRPEDGYPETVGAISREDVVRFHRRHFGPRGTVLAVVGAVDPEEVVDKVTSALGDWENESQPEPPPLPPLKPLEATVTEWVTIPGKSQADIVMGVAGPPRPSPDYLSAALGNSILGQFGMMGRIGEAVRERAGLAYYAHSSLGGGIGPGPWRIRAGVDPGNVEQTVDMIRQEIGRFVEMPVSEGELSDSQANFVGKLPLSLESNGGVASSLLNLERYELGLNYYRRFPGLVRAVTVEDILETARRYFHPDRLAIAVAGPQEAP